jgi:hypothetical protein
MLLATVTWEKKKKSTQDPGREAASDITISFQVPLYHIL